MIYIRSGRRSAFVRALMLALCVFLIFSSLEFKADAKNKSKKKLLAITFDDGPGLYTSDLIDRLNERDVKATFFIVGQNAEYYPEVVKKAADSGHELGNHSYDHPQLNEYGIDFIKEQISSTNRILKQADGKSIHLLRPPYGEFNDDVAASAGAPMIYWSVDTNDWRTLDAEAVYYSIMDSVYDGAIILLHDIYESSCDGAIMAIDELKSQGWEFCTVSELFEREGIEIHNGVMYYNASPDKASHVYGDMDEELVYPENPPEDEVVEEILLSDELLDRDAIVYSDAELTNVGGIISKGSVLHVYDAQSENSRRVTTDWGFEGYVPSKALEQTTENAVDETANINSRKSGKTRLSSGVMKLYADSSLTLTKSIMTARQELTLINSDNGVSAVKLADGRLGYVSSDKLVNYYSFPEKSTVLDFSDKGVLVTEVNLRIEPSSESAIRGVITYGAEVEILSRTGIWLEVSYAGYSGYVRDYTVSRDDRSCFVKASITEKTELYSKEGSGKIGTVKTGAVYILSEPDDYTLILTPSGSVGYVNTENLEY